MRRWWYSIAASCVLLALGAVASVDGVGRERRIDFQAALEAFQRGEQRLGIWILEGLAAGTEDESEKSIYAFHIARAKGDREAAAAAIDKGLEAIESAEEPRAEWIGNELIRLAGRSRFEEIRAERAASLEEILSRHYVARGGIDRLQAISQLIAEGRLIAGDQEMPFRLYRKRPQFYRLDLTTPGGSLVTASDGQIAWAGAFSAPTARVSTLSGETSAQLLQESYFDDILIRFRKTGEALLLAGEEEIDLGRAYRIEAKLPAGARRTIYLDADTLLEIRRVIHDPDGAPPTTIDIEHQEFSGLQFPSLQVVDSPGRKLEYLLTSYDLEEQVDSALFGLPHEQDSLAIDSPEP